MGESLHISEYLPSYIYHSNSFQDSQNGRKHSGLILFIIKKCNKKIYLKYKFSKLYEDMKLKYKKRSIHQNKRS